MKILIADPAMDGTVYTRETEFKFKQSNVITPVLAIGYAKTYTNCLGVLAKDGATIDTLNHRLQRLFDGR